MFRLFNHCPKAPRLPDNNLSSLMLQLSIPQTAHSGKEWGKDAFRTDKPLSHMRIFGTRLA